MNRLKAILLCLAAASPVAVHLTTASLTTAPAIASGYLYEKTDVRAQVSLHSNWFPKM
jgi:hypothetical protein